mmetsp:Transcript_52225/g.151755  ORF Transcript_52225/g.151755 Transcript_52225/m.151755 type:complete len:230 (-) Transcript_52225:23-712(-)
MPRFWRHLQRRAAKSVNLQAERSSLRPSSRSSAILSLSSKHVPRSWEWTRTLCCQWPLPPQHASHFACWRSRRPRRRLQASTSCSQTPFLIGQRMSTRAPAMHPCTSSGLLPEDVAPGSSPRSFQANLPLRLAWLPTPVALPLQTSQRASSRAVPRTPGLCCPMSLTPLVGKQEALSWTSRLSARAPEHKAPMAERVAGSSMAAAGGAVVSRAAGGRNEGMLPTRRLLA